MAMATCGHCGAAIHLTPDGLIKSHRVRGNRKGHARCGGSCEPPLEVRVPTARDFVPDFDVYFRQSWHDTRVRLNEEINGAHG